jgi:hypothetical protein
MNLMINRCTALGQTIIEGIRVSLLEVDWVEAKEFTKNPR